MSWYDAVSTARIAESSRYDARVRKHRRYFHALRHIEAEGMRAGACMKPYESVEVAVVALE